MITAITLENFKGISQPVTIPLRPLTIMFGKNSAGKSTVVQALHYAREIFERNNLNADRTLIGGSSVDLGGFRNLVNNHDLSKQIVIRFDLDISDSPFPDYEDLNLDLFIRDLANQNYFNDEEKKKMLDASQMISSLYIGDSLEPTIFEEIENSGSSLIQAAVEIKVQWSETLKKPVLVQYQTWLLHEPAGRIQTSLDEKNIVYEININHKLLHLRANESSIERGSDSPEWRSDFFYHHARSLPVWEERLGITPGHAAQDDAIGSQAITEMLVAPGDIVTQHLKKFRYLGPIRTTPPRNFQPSMTEEESDWANGLAAWRELYNKNDFFFDLELIIWLEEKLKTGYRVKLKQFRETPLNSDELAGTAIQVKDLPIQKKLVLIEAKSGIEVMPHDIGVGISQVMPVIVAALISNHQIVAIEQPELHLHPAMQSELGDLFIESALGDKKNLFLIETHSEHLILRVLRRIRETTRGKAETPITPENVSLLFVGELNKQTDFLNLRIDKNGRIIDRVPGGFFEEDFAEIF